MYKLIAFFRPFSVYFLAVWILAIITVSSVPSIPTLKIHTRSADIRLDYLIHLLEYASLAFLAYLSFSGRGFKISKAGYFFITAGLVLFASADEFHQLFIPGRTFNPCDLISNIAGVACGLVFCIIVFRKMSKNFPG